MTLTKADLVDRIHEDLDLPRSKSAKTLESLLEIIKASLGTGEDVLISGFGKFCVKDKKKRRGRNPQTGDDLILPPRRIVTFRYSPVLRDRINGED